MVRPVRRPFHLLLVLLLLAIPLAGAAGCGDDDEPADEPPTTQEPSDEAPGGQEPDAQDEPAGPDPLAAAGINPTTGSFSGLAPDTREGTPPPSVPGDLKSAAQKAGCTLQLNLPDELRPVPASRTHLQPGEPPPEYGTNPPTSGRHDPTPVADGAYRKTPPAVAVVHSLEHGRVAIQYSPSLPAAQQLALKGAFDEDPGGLLLFPNGDMPYEVAVTGWRNLMGCKQVKSPQALVGAVLAFSERFRGKGPEDIPF